MFNLVRTSLFFEQASAEHPTFVQNIEVVQENKINLDATYHFPKQFILGLNNFLQSLMFFIEHAIKNSPDWLHNSVQEFCDANRNDYEIIKYLRNVSAHQKLIFPDESLASGLYRIKSGNDYTFKLGVGDFNKPGKYSPDLALKNTEEIFHDLLSFSSLMFMDLEHSAFFECLGITRRWFFKVHFKTKEKRYDDVVDVYALSTRFGLEMLDHVCDSYAAHKGIVFGDSFKTELPEYNNVNTLLEVDLYPSLFSEWWEDEWMALNYGVRHSSYYGDRNKANDEFHTWVYKNLTSDIAEYKKSLNKFIALSVDEIFKEDVFGEFLSFITINHWHFKKACKSGIMNSPISPSDVMKLQRIGGMLIEEHRKEKLCTIMSLKEQLDLQLRKMDEALDENKI